MAHYGTTDDPTAIGTACLKLLHAFAFFHCEWHSMHPHVHSRRNCESFVGLLILENALIGEEHSGYSVPSLDPTQQVLVRNEHA